MSVFDSIRNRIFAAKVSDTVKDDPKPERQLFSTDSRDDRGHLWKDNKLSMKDYRTLAYSVPLFYKASNKKNMDIYRGWPILESPGQKKIPLLDQQIFDSFNNRTNIQYKACLNGISADIYGTGFSLISFADDDDDQDLSLPPEKHLDKRLGRYVYSEPRKLTPFNSELVVGADYLNDEYRASRVMHYIYEVKMGDKKYIHPDRVYVTKYDELPFSVLGISKTYILRNVLDSLVDIDVATGETLKWSSHGLIIWQKNQLKEPERLKMLNILGQHPNGFVIDEYQKLTVEKPNAIDPKPFYDFLCLEIASAFVMPVHILTGVEVGKTTGAEVGYGDYRKDISDVQILRVNPSLVKLYIMLFESHGRDFDYKLVWPETYIDEMSEANIGFKRSAIVDRLYKSGTADRAERREVMNNGQTYLDPDKESTEESPDQMKKQQPVEVKRDTSKDKEVGETELISQELRLEEARLTREKHIKSFVAENK